MSTTKFKSMLVNESEDNKFSREIVNKEISSLPEGDVLIYVDIHSCNLFMIIHHIQFSPLFLLTLKHL